MDMVHEHNGACGDLHKFAGQAWADEALLRPENGGVPKDTVTQSLEWLLDAEANLDSVEATLVGTNSYADGPRRDLDRAFETIRMEILANLSEWSECPECGGVIRILGAGRSARCTSFGQCELAPN